MTLKQFSVASKTLVEPKISLDLTLPRVEIEYPVEKVIADGKGLGVVYRLDCDHFEDGVERRQLADSEIPVEIKRAESALAEFKNLHREDLSHAALRTKGYLARFIKKPCQSELGEEYIWKQFAEEFAPMVSVYRDFFHGTEFFDFVEKYRDQDTIPENVRDLLLKFKESAKLEIDRLSESWSAFKDNSLDERENRKENIYRQATGSVEKCMPSAFSLISQGNDAVWSVFAAFSDALQVAKEFEEIDPVVAKNQIEEIESCRLLMLKLLDPEKYGRFAAEEPVICVGKQIQLPILMLIDESLQAGVVTQIGDGSHIAAAGADQGMPVVKPSDEVLEALLSLPSGTKVLVDSERQRIIVDPCPRAIEEYEKYKDRPVVDKPVSARTLDNAPVKININLSKVNEGLLSRVSKFETDIGLVRSEVVFERDGVADASIEHQKVGYTRIFNSTSKSVIIRTWDTSNDKEKYGPVNREQSLNQLVAILGSATNVRKNASILFPHVDGVEKMLADKHLLEEAKSSLPANKLGSLEIKVGAQVECLKGVENLLGVLNNPDARPDFIAVGTNDLGIDVENAFKDSGEPEAKRDLSDIDNYSPNFLKALKKIVTDVRSVAPEMPIEVCGFMAGRPWCVPLLLGAGIRELSASMGNIAGVESACSKVSLEDCENLFEDLISSVDSSEVKTKLCAFNQARGLPLVS